ncbi:DegT/DnrJ/EryC1/StrS family aminotransferase [Hymenobacter sp. UV11]|uniref:DegT/DnrJ/EryC1/StrS family aminotransferase n=1 Tax=Hymenobacter sp. UV11 TaxID=1849735 RepID=UPI00105B741B|nr:DegT/DnrJ/EryC1/StrS family aminotransferase [Hymenobacter sp. UV11]TDN35863.1 aminotransferase [Hymenobacter sp. UV11]TFZ67405.1 DegT/DnrJ/EryC1/StrS family aminotransferase [Hymenobacter sp. UV11]
MHIPFFSSQPMHAAIRGEMLVAMARVYDSNWYVLGKEVTQFEQAYSEFSQVTHTVGVGNGLEALTLALRALGIGRGDEVIVPSNTFIATWLAVTHVGATPVPVEPELTTSNLDPELLAAAITPRTRAIIPVHLYGQACRMPAIMALAHVHGLQVMEDNAQAQGAAFDGQLTGSFGAVNTTSFYPTKNLGALGDAGAITTNSEELAQRLRVLRNYGSVTKNHHETVGYNSRLDELQAALLRAKLSYLAEWTAQRQQIAAWYTQHLAGITNLRLPTLAAGATHVYHLYVVHTPFRDALQGYLATQGIGTQVHYPVPPHLQSAYTQLNLPIGSLPVAEELAATCLSLPLWPGMTEDMVGAVASAIRRF